MFNCLLRRKRILRAARTFIGYYRIEFTKNLRANTGRKRERKISRHGKIAYLLGYSMLGFLFFFSIDKDIGI